MRLVIRSGARAGESVDVVRQPFVIGRDAGNDLVLDDTTVSRRHAALEVFGDRALLRDLGSTNGVFVDGTRVEGSASLAPGQAFSVGDAVLELVDEPGVEEPPSWRAPDARRRLMPQQHAGWILALAGVAIAMVVVLVVLLVAGVLPPRDDADDDSVEDIVATGASRTALVEVELDGDGVAAGTGWVLDADDGLIVTNAHVVTSGDAWTVTVGQGDEQDARLVGVAPCEDLAVLQVEDSEGLRAFELGSQDELRQGQEVVALGFPVNASGGDDLAATTGVVSVVRTTFALDPYDVPEYKNVIQTDAAINPGNSGGPLVDLRMHLVGVNSAGITLVGDAIIQGQGYAIGVDQVRAVVPGLVAGQSPGWAGLVTEFVTDRDDLEALGLPARSGLVVLGTVPGSPAAEAGLGRAPFLVTEIDGERMDGSLPAYCEAVGDAVAGDTAVLSVRAGGSERARDVTVEFS